MENDCDWEDNRDLETYNMPYVTQFRRNLNNYTYSALMVVGAVLLARLAIPQILSWFR